MLILFRHILFGSQNLESLTPCLTIGSLLAVSSCPSFSCHKLREDTHLPAVTFQALSQIPRSTKHKRNQNVCMHACAHTHWSSLDFYLILFDSFQALSTHIRTHFKFWDRDVWGGITWDYLPDFIFIPVCEDESHSRMPFFCFFLSRDTEKIIKVRGIGREGTMGNLKTTSVACLLSNPGYRKISFTITSASHSRSEAKIMKNCW